MKSTYCQEWLCCLEADLRAEQPLERVMIGICKSEVGCRRS